MDVGIDFGRWSFVFLLLLPSLAPFCPILADSFSASIRRIIDPSSELSSLMSTMDDVDDDGDVDKRPLSLDLSAATTVVVVAAATPLRSDALVDEVLRRPSVTAEEG